MTVEISSLQFYCYSQTETLRTSNNDIVKILFTNLLSKTGNLTVAYEEQVKTMPNQKTKWGAALVAEKQIGKVQYF